MVSRKPAGKDTNGGFAERLLFSALEGVKNYGAQHERSRGLHYPCDRRTYWPVTDFLFDDEAWVVRYLVVDTGSWLSSRKVLISPISIGEPTWTDRTLPASITKEQVKNSPDIDTDKPVSRQYELGYFGYYGYYPYYWGASGLWAASDYPNTLLMGLGRAGADVEPQTVAADRARVAREVDQHRNDDPHPVSYTHLDVYKRQVEEWDRAKTQQ